MRVKLFEVRDRATFIPCIAIKPGDGDLLGPARERLDAGIASMADVSALAQRRLLLVQAGWWGENGAVLFGKLNGGRFETDAHAWGDRTMQTAHLHIEQRFDELEDGAVVDVRFVLGETDKPATPTRLA